MKMFNKIGITTFALVLTAGATSCSNGDWGFSDFEGGTSAYFAMQAPIRTITLGNDDDAVNVDDNNHQFKVQAVMGGVYSNDKDRNINYTVDASLLTDPSMEVLPAPYYEMKSPYVLTIPAGKIIGGTTVKLTDAFFNDPKAATTHYVLPIRMTSTSDVDRILKEKSTQLLCIKYKNQYAGLYCKTGATVWDDVTTTQVNEDDLWKVTTINMHTVQMSVNNSLDTYKADEKGVLKKDKSYVVEFTVTMEFDDEGNCKVMQNGMEIGEGTFTPRGIQDFSDSKRMADCLRLNFKANAKISGGGYNGEMREISADYVMSLMSRDNKLESWQ